ncbi:MAG: dihydroorotase [Elusimicrobia bacterium]|nr:dihydroorotase [Elusimicrobiota bacterium]
MKTLISGGLVVDPSQNLEAVRDVWISDGKIEAIRPAARGPFSSRAVPGDIAEPGAARPARQGSKPASQPENGLRVIDAKGQWVIPGLIDMHVHLREPGCETEESIATGTRAAALGGVTTVLAMPNTDPVVDSPALVKLLRSRATTDALVNVVIAGAVTRGQKGAELAEMGRMSQAGAVAFTDDGRPIMNAQVMRRALEYLKGLDRPLLDHCEDENLSAGGVLNEGAACAAKGLPGIPKASETLMAMRDVALAEWTGGRLHLCHISCAETVGLVRRAKRRGAAVTAEAAPHHFTLTDSDVEGYDADFKMNPPLRAIEDVEAIQEGLRDGTIDAVATDHAPHAAARKALPMAQAPFGVIGLETLLPLTLALVERGLLTKKSLVRAVSTRPALILGLKQKGGLRPGMDADVTVVDSQAAALPAQCWASKSRNSPFKGKNLKGRATAVLVGGRLVVQGGNLAGSPPDR